MNTQTHKNQLRIMQIRNVVLELKDFWPLTVRQVHYQLVVREADWGYFEGGMQKYTNTRDAYQTLSRLLLQSRIEGKISWMAIQDATRIVKDSSGMEDVEEHVDAAENWFNRYQRSLSQDQQNYLEIWIEKMALMQIVAPVATEYCVRLACCRGFTSGTMAFEYLKRAEAAVNREQTPILLFLSDFDPSGLAMLPAIGKRISKDLQFPHVEYVRVALTKSQIEDFDLPLNPDAIKEKDPRAKKFIEEFGEYSVELDSLHPSDLQKILRESIQNYVDLELMEEQRKIQKSERQRLKIFTEEFRELRERHRV